jgi:hypothetical protein
MAVNRPLALTRLSTGKPGFPGMASPSGSKQMIATPLRDPVMPMIL